MTLHLILTPELEERLRQEAQRLGQPSETIALQLLADHLPQPLDERRAAAIAMLPGWMKEDDNMSAHEEAETPRFCACLTRTGRPTESSETARPRANSERITGAAMVDCGARFGLTPLRRSPKRIFFPIHDQRRQNEVGKL
ncbi:MAG TPA: hypothetical protein VG099_02705 [Gemmataceae bacterium]|jgi:hypothetical protein|nr:hypothetical protein [Gemmataceae bacterium]